MARIPCTRLLSKKLQESFRGPKWCLRILGQLVVGAMLGRTVQASKMAEALGISKWALHKGFQRLHERYVSGEVSFDPFKVGMEALASYYRNRKYVPVLIDPTKIPMKGVGRVQPRRAGERPEEGLLELTAAVPLKGSRCLLVDELTVTSDLISATATSRNIIYSGFIRKVYERFAAIGLIPVFVTDREFGCEWILREFVAEGVLFAARLPRNVSVVLPDGRRVVLKKFVKLVRPGTYRFSGCRYKGKVPINLVIHKRKPRASKKEDDDDCLIIATNLSNLDLALSFYRKRMEIEESIRDEKSGIFNLHKTQYRRLDRFEFVAKLVAFAHNICVISALRLFRSKTHRFASLLVQQFKKRILSLATIGWRYICRLLQEELAHFLTPYLLRQRKALAS